MKATTQQSATKAPVYSVKIQTTIDRTLVTEIVVVKTQSISAAKAVYESFKKDLRFSRLFEEWEEGCDSKGYTFWYNLTDAITIACLLVTPRPN